MGLVINPPGAQVQVAPVTPGVFTNGGLVHKDLLPLFFGLGVENSMVLWKLVGDWSERVVGFGVEGREETSHLLLSCHTGIYDLIPLVNSEIRKKDDEINYLRYSKSIYR